MPARSFCGPIVLSTAPPTRAAMALLQLIKLLATARADEALRTTDPASILLPPRVRLARSASSVRWSSISCGGSSAPTNRQVLSVCALLGAIFLIWGDVGARSFMAPQEFPIGIVGAAFGGMFLSG
ncbi:MAG: hypothetical protein EXQ91_00920 [Alphaproteobacteria bacterium]|nr:hypothetical protein [Alphaproteobacteria bacterium]